MAVASSRDEPELVDALHLLRSNQAMIARARKAGFGVTAPLAVAGLLRMVKDLAVRDGARSWNELASRSWLNAA
jgi:hypothetical protein